MPDWNSRHAGNSQPMRELAEYVVEGSAGSGGIAAGAVSKYDCLAAIQYPTELELLEHSVYAVNRFVHIFEDQNPVGEIGHIWRPTQRRQHREVSADQSSFCGTRVQLSRVARYPARVSLLDDGTLK